MSGIDVAAVLAELNECMPLWIGKIYQFDARTMGIRLNGKEGRHYQLILEVGRRAHLLSQFPEPPKNPTGFAMLLRKHLKGGRVLAIGQLGIQRIFYLEIGRRETVLRLYIELFDEGNAILCDGAGAIIMPLLHQKFRDRTIAPSEVYTPPPGKDCLSLAIEEFGDLLSGQKREIVKILATDCMLGGAYAEELCRRLGIDKRTPAPEVDPALLHEGLMTLYREARIRRAPVITKSGCWPFLPAGEEPIERFETFSHALERYYGLPAREEERSREAPIPKEELIRMRQQRVLAKFEEEIGRLQRCVDAIYGNYSLVEEVIRVLGDASRTRSWEEIKGILESSGHPVAGLIRAYHPSESAVEIDLGERVKIHVRKSLQENVAGYYEALKKFRRKKEGALAAMAKPLKREEKTKKRAVVPKRRWYQRFRWFHTSDGALVIGGRDADQNEELVKRYLEKKDLFLHADVHGASVTILKGGEGSIDEAAAFAAAYSGAWKSGHLTADVYAVEPSQVSKAAPSGEYVSKGGFMIRGERRYFRNLPMAIAIGVQLEPEFSVIGGPPEVIARRAKVRVELRPGRFEPNDVTKKVLRLLREQLIGSGLEEYSRLVRSEDVAAFVPPGGSDIVGDHEG
ncbi:MAG: ribosome rescue protein RqcH [Methanomicrobiales archaeon]|nr:ribosome rescue protein RqcH [Methanomicrobiales archaeon]